MTTELNIERLEYLMTLYKMSPSELLSIINEGLKKLYSTDDIFTENIDLRALKKIDKIFQKGLYFYIDPTPIRKTLDASIFFRKASFGTELNIKSRKVVNEFEELKHSLSATLKLSDIKLDRKLPVFNALKNTPKDAATIVRNDIYPTFTSNKRNFLKGIVNRIADHNIFVFEFVEYHNTKEKANIDGFFLKPNVIVIKRQKSQSRELFTLAHELGHLLLNHEEVESYDYIGLDYKKLSAVERWCNEFAFYFLIGEYDDELKKITVANAGNDYCHNLIESISQNTNISRIALFTHLLFERKISQLDYENVKQELDEQYIRQEIEKLRLLDHQNGKSRGVAPKPLTSPLFVSSMQAAYYSGAISEYDFYNALQKTLKITSNFEKYL